MQFSSNPPITLHLRLMPKILALICSWMCTISYLTDALSIINSEGRNRNLFTFLWPLNRHFVVTLTFSAKEPNDKAKCDCNAYHKLIRNIAKKFLFIDSSFEITYLGRPKCTSFLFSNVEFYTHLHWYDYPNFYYSRPYNQILQWIIVGSKWSRLTWS